MAPDFLSLLHRDHHDLACGLAELMAPSSVAQFRSALDGVRLGLTAHAEAEDIVLFGALNRCRAVAHLTPLVGEARAAHGTQEQALSMLVCARPGSDGWRERAAQLRQLVLEHARWEEEHVVVKIRDLAPEVYEALAGAFATERLRQLAMLQPSAPIEIGELASAAC